MSNLPETEDLPRSEDGLDPARLEEAFATFADRVRELESVAAELRLELRELREERAQRPTAPPLERTWEGDDWEPPPFTDPPDWVAGVPPPLTRPFAVPRLALEALFLVAVALLAGLADLSALGIVGVMAAAWALVAASEWSAAAARARWRLDEVAPSLTAADGETTGPWSMPVVGATVIAPPDDSESRTVIATLPAEREEAEEAEPAPEDEDSVAAEGEAEVAQPRRGLRRWRRRAAEPAADPWETGAP